MFTRTWGPCRNPSGCNWLLENDFGTAKVRIVTETACIPSVGAVKPTDLASLGISDLPRGRYLCCRSRKIRAYCENTFGPSAGHESADQDLSVLNP
jgi:hypothetical protein